MTESGSNHMGEVFTPAPGITRAQVVAAARRWIGTPYQHQQRLRGIAVDCIGLPMGVARELGLISPGFDVQGYARTPDGHTLMHLAATHMRRRGIDTPLAPGMVIVCAVDLEPSHFGILADYAHGGLSLIHANARAHPPRVIETRLLFSRGLRFVAAFDLPGVSD